LPVSLSQIKILLLESTLKTFFSSYDRANPSILLV
jgi:hypothetical protein